MTSKAIVLDPIGDLVRISNIVRKILDVDINIDLDMFNPFKKPRNFATIIRDRRNAAYWKGQHGGNKSKKKSKKKNNRFRKTRNK